MRQWPPPNASAALLIAQLIEALRLTPRRHYHYNPLKIPFTIGSSLASGKGLCCLFADGYMVEDAEWQTTTEPISSVSNGLLRSLTRRLEQCMWFAIMLSLAGEAASTTSQSRLGDGCWTST